MRIEGQIAVVTGAAGGIGEAVAAALAGRDARCIAMVDRTPAVHQAARRINDAAGSGVAEPFEGDVTDSGFRRGVFESIAQKHGTPTICVPAAGILRDGLAVRIEKDSGESVLYSEDLFRQVVEINLIAPVYWSLELIAQVAADRRRRALGKWTGAEPIAGAIVFLGSISSRGNRGQISYASCKAGLIGAAATLQREALFHGLRTVIVHPGFVDTPMVHSMGEKLLREHVLPNSPLGRLIRPEEIADAICFAISNDAVSGDLWLDAGSRPPGS